MNAPKMPANTSGVQSPNNFVDVAVGDPTPREQMLPRSDGVNDNAPKGPSYKRTVMIDFPKHIAQELSVGGVFMSVGKFLTLFARECPESSARILEVRDRCCGGDDEDDHLMFEFDSNVASISIEEGALRWKEDFDRRDEREQQCRAIIEEDLANLRQERVMWLPLAQERETLSADDRAIEARTVKLREDWRDFLVASETWDPRAEEQRVRIRDDLILRETVLMAEKRDRETQHEALYERLRALQERGKADQIG